MLRKKKHVFNEYRKYTGGERKRLGTDDYDHDDGYGDYGNYSEQSSE